jgi:hypothetical protein
VQVDVPDDARRDRVARVLGDGIDDAGDAAPLGPQQQRQEQRFLVGEVQVDRALADAGVAGDLVDRDALVAPAQQQLAGGVED